MAELKTRKNSTSVKDFIASVENETRRNDGFELLELFKRATGQDPVMWGTAIVGYGEYHYKSERSSQEGDWPLTAFSPRKQNMTVYIMPGFEKLKPLLSKLGKHKTSVSCLYINKLADVDLHVLEEIVRLGYNQMKEQVSNGA